MNCMLCGTPIINSRCWYCGNNKGTLMSKTTKNEIRIRVQCTANLHHAKILRFQPETPIAFIEALAALINGTHPAYITKPNPGPNAPIPDRPCEFCGERHAPGKHSPIGRCAICGATLETTIERIDQAPAPDVGGQLRASLEEDAEHTESLH